MKKLSHRNWNKWDNKEVNYLKDNYNKISLKEIANELHRNYDSISHKMFKLKLDSRNLWTEDENNVIRNEYWCNPKVWNSLKDRSRVAITQQARKLGVQRKCGNYSINYKFFENWNPEVAYIVGFFMADGCVEPKINRISCELSMKDYTHLFKIKNILRSENPICIKKYRNSCALYIHNKKMVSDIIKKGVIPNKTYRQRFPSDIPNEYKIDLIRGLLDGDGSIKYDKNTNQRRIQFLGSEKLLIEVHNFLMEKCNVNNIKIQNLGNFCRINYGSKENTQKIIDLLYYKNCLCLERKLGLARGVIPRKIETAQISQVISYTNKEPERKTDNNQINAQRLNAVLLNNNLG